jgi:hypothetical protein
MNAIDFIVSAPRAAHCDARTCTALERTRLASIPRAVGVSLQRGVEAGQTTARVGERPRAACYNSGRSMLGRDWALLVTGTLLGVVSLTADLVGLGAFPGFGWKQVVGTTAALGIVIRTGWRIYQASRQDRS